VQTDIQVIIMENSDLGSNAGLCLASFLAEEEKLAEQKLRNLNRLLSGHQEETAGSSFPSQVVDTLNLIRQNAEEDLSNILHIQSIYTSRKKSEGSNKLGLKLPSTSLKNTRNSPVKSAFGLKNVFADNGAVLGQVEESVETAMAATDDMFLLEGVDNSDRSPQSPTYSEEDHEDSELDEGIHIPNKRTLRTPVDTVAASLPVGIPWPAQVNFESSKEPVSRTRTMTGETSRREEEGKPKDIAASIQAIAKSVHTSSMFGDNVFGELPRPRLNTLSKD